MTQLLNIFNIRKIFHCLLLTSSITISLPAVCEYQYIISHNHHDSNINFKTKPRLNDLIQHAEILHQKIFWEAVGLFDYSNPNELKTLQMKTLESLKSLTVINPRNKNALKSLLAFMAKIKVKPRQLLDIEPDKILTNLAANPLLANKLLLNIPNRPNHILLLSNLFNVHKVHFNTLTTTRGYLNEIYGFSTLGVDTVVVIQPNGQTITSPVAYWNDKKERLLPGSVIFVPFKELPDSLSSLNNDIIRLLQHRVL